MLPDKIEWTHISSQYTRSRNTFGTGLQNGIKWSWMSSFDISTAVIAEKSVYFAWQFNWDDLKTQGIEGLEGTIDVSYVQHPANSVLIGLPKTVPVKLTRSGQCVELYLGTEKDVSNCLNGTFQCSYRMWPIKNGDEARFLEETFAASDKTDAILVVEGKKLHVNKQFLSFHSDYFNTMFNSEFKEKSMEEIPIEDVSYDNFARLLSVVYPNPILPTVETSVSLLQLADRFMMSKVTFLVEPFLIRNENVRLSEKIALADKYSLKKLLEACLNSLNSLAEVKKIAMTADFEGLSDATKAQILNRILSFP